MSLFRVVFGGRVVFFFVFVVWELGFVELFFRLEVGAVFRSWVFTVFVCREDNSSFGVAWSGILGLRLYSLGLG